MIYLDYAATSPIEKEVIDTITQAMQENYGNPSSIYRIGRREKNKIALARRNMANHLNIEANKLFFTSGATEANNWALASQAYQAKELGYGNEIISTSIEHPSVHEVLEHLSNHGFKIHYLDPRKDYVNQFKALTNENTIGWVAMAVNNEVGTILPIQTLGDLAKEQGVWFHVDAVQALSHMEIDFGEMNCTSFVGSAHKFGGPKGIGFLVYQPFDKKMTLQPFILGGGQEYKKRSGTENTSYIFGMSKAMDVYMNDLPSRINHYQMLSHHLIQTLDQTDIEYEVNGAEYPKVANVTNLWFKGMDSHQLLIKLDMKDIFISAGSACSAGTTEPSRILQAMYPNEKERWSQSVRISFGSNTTVKEIDQFVEAVLSIYKEVKE